MNSKIKLFILLLGILTGCQRSVDLDTVDKIMFGYNFGYNTETYWLTVYPTKEEYRYGNEFKCENGISSNEWQDLVRDFDWKGFKNTKSSTEPNCCDKEGTFLKVTVGQQEHEIAYIFQPPNGLPEVLEEKLSNRLNMISKKCF